MRNIKKLFFSLMILGSFSSYATEIADIDRALLSLLGNGSRQGVSSKGLACEVTNHSGRQVNLMHLGAGCMASHGTINTECLVQYMANYATLKVEKAIIKKDYLLAEVRAKDSEQYTSAVTTQIEIVAGAKTKVTIFNKKGFFGGYKQVLDCIL